MQQPSFSNRRAMKLAPDALQTALPRTLKGLLPCLPAAFAAVALSCVAAAAQTPPASSNAPLSGLGTGKDPIKIDADRLDIFDQEKRATFTGNVVAVQGDTTMRCSALNVFYEQSAANRNGGGQNAQGGAKNAQAPAGGQGGGQAGTGDNNIRKLDCQGPVTVVSKDQTATGQHAVFDRTSNTVTLTGNVALSQDKNVQQCDRIVYNLDTSIANCIARPGGRVQGVFVPGSGGAPKR